MFRTNNGQNATVGTTFGNQSLNITAVASGLSNAQTFNIASQTGPYGMTELYKITLGATPRSHCRRARL